MTTAIQKRARAVREQRALRDRKGQFVADPTHSQGVVFGNVKSKPVAERAFPFVK